MGDRERFFLYCFAGSDPSAERVVTFAMIESASNKLRKRYCRIVPIGILIVVIICQRDVVSPIVFFSSKRNVARIGDRMAAVVQDLISIFNLERSEGLLADHRRAVVNKAV
jgi:hypothetical protein